MDEAVANSNSTIPTPVEKDLQAMNQLMAEKQYRIKAAVNFLRPDRSDRVNPDFLLYTLNDYLGHIQKCVTSTKKMIPFEKGDLFLQELSKYDPISGSLLTISSRIDLPQLTRNLQDLQKRSSEIVVTDLNPFMQILFKSLIRVYYLGAPFIAKKYHNAYSFLLQYIVPSDVEILRSHVSSAVEEWYYIFEKIFPGLYPLVLRFSSSTFLTFQQLFYANGSKVLTWLDISPSAVLIQRVGSDEPSPLPQKKPVVTEEKINKVPKIPEEVQKGLIFLERLFPEAGWDSLEQMPDFCPYFQNLMDFKDAFVQLAPENPLHTTLVLFWILEEIFPGLRLIGFESLDPESLTEDVEGINTILEEWILYQELVFDKQFSVDLKSFTHQIYTQPDFAKSPYGRKLLSNMYSLIKCVYLPHFDIKMYGTSKFQKDDRLPPFFVRVRRLKRLLSRYNRSIHEAPLGSASNSDNSVLGVVNPWAIYKFDIPNALSTRLDALAGGKFSKARTNAYLIDATYSILTVLDWWVNDKNSFAYKNDPDFLYRVIEPGSTVPAFGVTSRTDIDTLFLKHLKGGTQ